MSATAGASSSGSGIVTEPSFISSTPSLKSGRNMALKTLDVRLKCFGETSIDVWVAASILWFACSEFELAVVVY